MDAPAIHQRLSAQFGERITAFQADVLQPWAVVFRKLAEEPGVLPYVEGLVFIDILVVALAYVWRKGNLEWVRAEDRT